MSDSAQSCIDASIDLPHVVEVAIDLIDRFIACFEGGSPSSATPQLREGQQFPEDLCMAIGAACHQKVLTDAGVTGPEQHSPTTLLKIIKSQLQVEPQVFWQKCSEVREALTRIENVRRSYRWDRFETANVAIIADDTEVDQLLDAFAEFCWSNRHADFGPSTTSAHGPERSLFSYLEHRPKDRGKK